MQTGKLEQVQALAQRLLKQHGLTDWQFAFDNTVRQLGKCSHTKKLITVSRHYVVLNDDDLAKDIILHEIAHALTDPWCQPHGPEFKRIAKQIGAPPECHCPPSVKQPSPKWRAVCEECRRETVYHRRQQHGTCRWCRSPWLVWYRSPMRRTRPPQRRN